MPLWDYAAIHLIEIVFGARRQYLFPRKIYYASTAHKGIVLRGEGASGWPRTCRAPTLQDSPEPSCCWAQLVPSPLTAQKALLVPSCPALVLHSSPCLSSMDLHTPGILVPPSQRQAQCLGTARKIAISCWVPVWSSAVLQRTPF